MDDPSYLHHRQRMALALAGAASDCCSRASHAAMARAYGVRIDAVDYEPEGDGLSAAR
ncbi:hypothetical protein [Sphingomonas sanxanigenens]|uniref:Uncharacterized protein n=1 Tax=Sphingomonas sanxanigenens DSM 19645 = NX02 TaxID=1123269 RepID=W0A8N6_9SPHN|nr:hypothetical protein [Sphingomonas sanxanigenens]AHE52005.1 hypothetical protein NX02_01195 [Sphingomonas sanxanigenens DSM 19645 = NX02]